MSRHTRPVVGLLLSMLLTGTAAAQYIGPGTQRAPGSLTELLQRPIDGQQVQLHGRLLQKLNHNKFLFSDGKSQIRVQINPEQFPAQPLDDKTEIDLTGTVEKDFMDTPEIDVKTLVAVERKAASTDR